MSNPKNIQEYVGMTVIKYMNSKDKLLLDKIHRNPELQDFIERVDEKKFTQMMEFFKYGLDVHETYKCEKHDVTFTYETNDEEADWYSEDTEYECNYILTDIVRSTIKKEYPCCLSNEDKVVLKCKMYDDAEESE